MLYWLIAVTLECLVAEIIQLCVKIDLYCHLFMVHWWKQWSEYYMLVLDYWNHPDAISFRTTSFQKVKLHAFFFPVVVTRIQHIWSVLHCFKVSKVYKSTNISFLLFCWHLSLYSLVLVLLYGLPLVWLQYIVCAWSKQKLYACSIPAVVNFLSGSFSWVAKISVNASQFVCSVCLFQ